MTEFRAADIDVRLSHEGDDHADMANGDFQHVDLFHADEPGVQVPRAGEEDLFLQAATSAAFQKRLGVLEVLVRGDDLTGDFARVDGATIQRRDDPDRIGFHGVDMELFRHQRVVRGMERGDDGEHRRVDPVGTCREDGELAALLATIKQEGAGVLEVIAEHALGQDPFRRNGRTGIGHDESDFSRRNAEHLDFNHPVLEEPITEMEPRREGIGLITGFALKGDKLPGRQLARPEFLDHHPDFLFIDHDHTGQPRADDGQDDEVDKQGKGGEVGLIPGPEEPEEGID